MTDASRRRSERAAAAGDALAAARLLVERVRSGDLAPARLELAAHLGDPAACVALGRPPEPVTRLAAHVDDPTAGIDPGDPPPAQLEAWLRRLALLDGETRARVALAAVAVAEPAWSRERGGDRSVRATLAAIRRWLDRGEPDPADAELLEVRPDWIGPTDLRWAARQVSALVEDRRRAPGPYSYRPGHDDDGTQSVLLAARTYPGELRTFFEAVRADVLPWVLRGPT